MPVDALDQFRIDSVLTNRAAEDAEADKVGQNQFLEMLVAQLENQDPLNPQDSADFAAQLAQFSTVEQLIAVREGVDELVAKTPDGVPEVGGASDASRLDPASLLGLEVVAFGSQIQIDESGSEIRMPYRTVDQALEARVRIYDENGTLRHEESILPRNAEGQEVALRAGDYDYVFDPAEHALSPGVYSIEFDAVGMEGEEIDVLPMDEGIVTGAILVGDPAVRIGDRVYPTRELLEVRLPGAASS